MYIYLIYPQLVTCKTTCLVRINAFNLCVFINYKLRFPIFFLLQIENIYSTFINNSKVMTCNFSVLYCIYRIRGLNKLKVIFKTDKMCSSVFDVFFLIRSQMQAGHVTLNL